jgi:hypothetical protein
MVFVAPALLGAAFLVDARLDDLASRGAAGVRARALTTAALVGLLWVWLGDFQLHYFTPLRRTGGESYPQYRAAAVEPKRQALRLLVGDLAARGRPRAEVLVDNYFLFYALDYLALPRPALSCEMLAVFGVEKPEAQERAVSRVESGAYLVTWAGARVEASARRTIAPERLRVWSVRDAGGRPVITVLRVRDPGETATALAAPPSRR